MEKATHQISSILLADDLLSGMRLGAICKRYGLTKKQLRAAIEKTIEMGLVSQEQIDARFRVSGSPSPDDSGAVNVQQQSEYSWSGIPWKRGGHKSQLTPDALG